MKAQDAVNKIKELLGLEVKLATMKLEDGAVIEAEAFEAGNEIFVVTDEDRIALPVGTYKLEDGKSLVIEEEGVIASIGEAEAEAEAEAEESEEDLKEDKMEYASKEEMAEVKSAIRELQNAIEAMMPKEEKEDKEEMASEVEETKEEVKEELSAVETRETYHSPENKSEKKVFKLGARAYKGTQDMIFEKLFNK